MNTEKSKTPPSTDSRVPFVQRLDLGIQRVEGWAIFLLMGMLVLLTLLQVIFRLIPGCPSYPWLDTIARWLVLWVGLLGASLAAAQDKHINIDVLSRLLPDKWRSVVQGAAGLFALVVLSILVFSAMGFTLLKHEGAQIPILVLEFLGKNKDGNAQGIYDYFFTDPMPLILLVLLWHSFVAWQRGVKVLPGAKIWAWAVGIPLLLLTIVASLELFGTAENTPVVHLVDGTVGAMVKAAPLLVILVSLLTAMLGAPLYVVLAAVALVGLYAEQAIPIQNFFPDPVGNIRKSTIFLAIPLFTMAGYLMAEGNTPKRLVGLFRGFLGWLPGGVAIVALVACAFFTAFTGASGVTIIALGGLLFPILLADRYPEKFALGLLTTGGSRGLIFPPSIPIFLLAMIMGLNWDGATKGVDYGQAIQESTLRSAQCKSEVEAKRQSLAYAASHAAATSDVEDDADAEVEAALARLEGEPEASPEGRDEFEMGADDDFVEEELDEGGTAGNEDDEFEVGTDDDFDEGEPEKDKVADAAEDEFEVGGTDEDFDETEPVEDKQPLEGSQPILAAAAAENLEIPPPAAPAPSGPRLEAPTPQEVFLAGLVPGLLMVLAVAGYSIFVGFKSGVERTRFRFKDAGAALWQSRFELPIPIIIAVGIFGGFFTPAEAATVTAAYTILMELILYRDFGFTAMKRAVVESVVLVGGILVIMMAASGLLNFLVHADVPTVVLSFIEQTVPEELSVFGLFTIPRRITFLLLLNVFLLVVGCLMDIFSAILVVLPLLLPVSYRFGVHPLHLAVIFVTNLEIGYSTPPVGINLFVSSLRFGKPITKLYSASVAFLVIMLVGLLAVTYIPELSLWMLPEVTP